tara:strand:+ start:5389 stop:5748 length:360 start_codon:yes stop_codon:yes gene_type:complete
MKCLFTFYLIILFSSFCYGMGNPPEDTTHETAYNAPIPAIDEIDKIDVIVKGMTCAMCAQGIEKKLTENTAIKTIYVDFDRHLVSIVCHDKKAVSNTIITNAIDWAGYKVISINRYEQN